MDFLNCQEIHEKKSQDVIKWSRKWRVQIQLINKFSKEKKEKAKKFARNRDKEIETL